MKNRSHTVIHEKKQGNLEKPILEFYIFGFKYIIFLCGRRVKIKKHNFIIKKLIKRKNILNESQINIKNANANDSLHNNNVGTKCCG